MNSKILTKIKVFIVVAILSINSTSPAVNIHLKFLCQKLKKNINKTAKN